MRKMLNHYKNYSLIRFLAMLIIITASLSGILIALYEQKLAFQTSEMDGIWHLAFGR